MLWVLKRTISIDGSFKRQQHMLKVMAEKIIMFKLKKLT